MQGSVVVAGDEQAIPYANLLVLGTDTGVAADENGAFTLPLLPVRGSEATLVQVSAVGFRTDTFSLSAGKNIVLALERAANLPTITVSGGDFRKLKELRAPKFLPLFLEAWGDKVATCYKRSAKQTYELRLLHNSGVETRHTLSFGKITGLSTRCSERLYIMTEEFAVSMELRKGQLVPVERIPINDYRWLFADCQDRKGNEFLYERKRLEGLNKLYLLLAAGTEQRIIREYADARLLAELRARRGIMAWEQSQELRATGGHYWQENMAIRRAVARADFDVAIRYKNHNDNAIFFWDKYIKLVNFDEGLLETFGNSGEQLSAIPFSPDVDNKTTLQQRIFKDQLSDRTFALARDRKGHLVYDFNTDTGATRLLFRIDVEEVEELVVLGGRFYLLAQKDKYGMASGRRLYEGEI